MEDRAHHIHHISTIVMYVSIGINILNISYNIVALVKPDIATGSWVSVLQIISTIIGSILFGLSTTIVALYGSKTLGKINTESMIEELLHRYQQTDINAEALRVNTIMESIDVPQASPLYQEIHAFKGAIRDHMLTRKGLSGMLKILATIFLYYNCLTSIILYTGIVSLRANSQRLLFLMLNVINPLICLLISYLVVLCDNPKSIVIYSHRVNELLEARNEQLPAITEEIQGYIDRIERPLYHQMWLQ